MRQHILLLLLFLWIYARSAWCFNFDIKGVEEIHLKGGSSSYFGYALLMQKGTANFRPIVIVGAPGQGSEHLGGSVYSCIEEGQCVKYNIVANNDNSFNGNFLGSVLKGAYRVGTSFITCAPRRAKAIRGIKYTHNFLLGSCFIKYNSSSYATPQDFTINPIEKEEPITSIHSLNLSYYDYGFGQAGFDLHYMPDSSTLLLGAPGVKNWNGISMTGKITNLKKWSKIPERQAPAFQDNYSYVGYKVTSAKMGTQTLWYLLGSPRGSNLLGCVKIYTPNGHLVTTLTGEEFGSYYGSALLAVDTDNDGLDDIFVGAPTGAGASWDEGYVYFYGTVESKLKSYVKLVGGKKTGARFGTSIVSLGDIDLDSYVDVAISAPNEDDGVGAVYIYRGGKTGINQVYSQRLSPLDFPGRFGSVRGFGQGLSNGVDIDENGHNDLAVGAYRSNQVFVIKTLNVIDYILLLEPNVTSVSSNDMNVKFCLFYDQRSPAKDLKSLQFKIYLQFDYRVQGEKSFEYVWNMTLATPRCDSIDVSVQQRFSDITPLRVLLKSEILRPNIIGRGTDQIEKLIPFIHECGDDNVCQTQISVKAAASLQEIVHGLDKEMAVVVVVENVREPGYGCKLHMNFSNVLELRDTKDCDLENTTYVCPLPEKLYKTEKEIPLKFDIKLRKPNVRQAELNFEVTCLGNNLSPEESRVGLTLKVILKNSPHIQASSTPSNLLLDADALEDTIEATHIFTVGNAGPSPFKQDVLFTTPHIKEGDTDIFEYEATGYLNGIETQCKPIKVNFAIDVTYNVSALLTESTNKTIVVDSSAENVDCSRALYCFGDDFDYLYRPTEILEYKVKVTAKTKLLASHYKNDLLKKSILALITSASIASTDLQAQAVTTIFMSKDNRVPLWVYILAGALGIILLALLIFLLYKCHFFDRNYRDKLNDEKLMEQKMDDNMVNLQNVDLNDLPENYN
ncbi:hypothetical protein NQ315_006935 [Exocentrus adspersus]|uniref:Integrin alpha second immunoglobulin-like domain-containing protein n=1 Tax=Exocentrus adspersus TaxID=1586481 RepID=A0AAV8WC34_9CUCU|nr:hypothetical protein NQ315_006935 [Exocentrus adspersus]